MSASEEPEGTDAAAQASKRWDVDSQYAAPTGPDMAVDAAWNGINFVVRGWRWLRTRLSSFVQRQHR